jgi:phage-related protein
LAQTEVFFFRDPKDDSVPLLDWLDGLPTKVQAKCTERIDRLGKLGHDLRRPEADLLRDGIHELRASYQGVHYRMLYFFAGKAVVVVSHGLTKEREVPARDIAQAIARKRKVEADFEQSTFRPE